MTLIEAEPTGDEIAYKFQRGYPGRGLVVGLTDDGLSAFQIYWITGRSDASRQRQLVQTEEMVLVGWRSGAGSGDPSIFTYPAMLVVEDRHVVGNGTHTKEFGEATRGSRCMTAVLSGLTYEPDDYFTPRIAGVTTCRDGVLECSLYKIRRGTTAGDVFRARYDVDLTAPGVGWCLHTYRADASTPTAFTDDPYPVQVRGSGEQIATELWERQRLVPRVCLAVKVIQPSGHSRVYLINE